MKDKENNRHKIIYLGILEYTMITTTTIKLNKKTKKKLDLYREYKNESYDEVINKLLSIISISKNDPKLSQETLKAIDAARKRIKQGEYINEEEAMKRLGI